MPQTTSTQYFFNMPYSSMNSYHTGLGIRTFGTDTITRQAKPSWVVTKKDYPTSQQVTRAPVDAVWAPLMSRVFRSWLVLITKIPMIRCGTARPRYQNTSQTIGSGSHWGQRVFYPMGKWWVHCDYWSNSPTFYPVGKLWLLFKCAHQFAHILTSG